MSRPRARKAVPDGFRALVLSLAIVAPAQAGMVDTDEVLAAAGPQRAALIGALEREEIAARLEALGVSTREARARVARLTDREVARLHGRVETLPVGGHGSPVRFLLIIILILLLI